MTETLDGGGGAGLPDLAAANGLGSPDEKSAPPPALLVGFDVLGGRFAVDGGGLGMAPGEVCYWGPDSLSWVGLSGGHAAFVSWALGGGLGDFYAGLRWGGWEEMTEALPLDEGISVFPPPFTTEGRGPRVSRRPVPFAELLGFYDDAAAQLRAAE
jgi:hypothetical protein